MNHIPVFYSDRQVAHNTSFSPSAHKPREVVDSWRRLGIPINIIGTTPVSVETLCLAHDRNYVEGILSCRKQNGFGDCSPEVAISLPYTTGSFLGAAQEAIRNGLVAAAPCSGFHHAGYAHASGFCTFNGLAVAALSLKANGLAERVGILDCDLHFGDGTADIINELNLKDWIQHASIGRNCSQASQAEKFLHILPALVRSFAGCDVLLYQAGADPHIDDPMGGWLTTEQLKRRDRIVFETCKGIGLPVAWNLAGGYQTPLRLVLDIHDNTLRVCAAAYGVTVAPLEAVSAS